jgi:hypothetical protein
MANMTATLESDSEESVDMVTNRGNKLRKKARYVREGKLAPPSGPEVYKKVRLQSQSWIKHFTWDILTFTQTITHAGYERQIVSERPVLYDDDGYEIDSGDDDEGTQAALAAANESYPYSEVKIEGRNPHQTAMSSTLILYLTDILAPLTRPADLPEHPTLSRPFTSKPLTELTRQARATLQKERTSLWRMKHLLTLMSGDHDWISCEMLETEEDIHLFSDGRNDLREHMLEKQRMASNDEPVAHNNDLEDKAMAAALSALRPDGAEVPATVGDMEKGATEIPLGDDDVAMIDTSTDLPSEIPKVMDTDTTEAPTEVIQNVSTEVAKPTNTEDAEQEDTSKASNPPDEEQKHMGEEVSTMKSKNGVEVAQKDVEMEEAEEPLDDVATTAPDGDETLPLEEDQEEVPEPRRMRTRAQAQAASDNTPISRPRSATPSSNSSYIHPYFLAPLSAHPEPNLGLPPVEAEETRRLLQLYIQKQEEICRGSQKIYEGLMKAERLRKMVFKWAKADGHVGEMSDGEDWYDKEEWGLTEDLKKGQEEEEEDAATTAKKTRTRRQ